MCGTLPFQSPSPCFHGDSSQFMGLWQDPRWHPKNTWHGSRGVGVWWDRTIEIGLPGASPGEGTWVLYKGSKELPWTCLGLCQGAPCWEALLLSGSHLGECQEVLFLEALQLLDSRLGACQGAHSTGLCWEALQLSGCLSKSSEQHSASTTEADTAYWAPLSLSFSALRFLS